MDETRRKLVMLSVALWLQAAGLAVAASRQRRSSNSLLKRTCRANLPQRAV